MKLRHLASYLAISISLIMQTQTAFANGLDEIKKSGTLRHLGIPYANFITGRGDGMSVEIIKKFADYLGVHYEYVKTDWKNVINDLTGVKIKPVGDCVEVLGTTPVKGDVIANGFTILEWRKKVVNYSSPIFPTQVWLVARADSDLAPIKGTGDIEKDIAKVKKTMKGHTVLGKLNTCLDPSLYGVVQCGATPVLFEGSVNDLAPAVIYKEAETVLLDVPDALVALKKWPEKIKIIGPVSPMQNMGVAFGKSCPRLLEEFEKFLEIQKRNGVYLQIVKKYYDNVFLYYPAFFK